MNLIKSIGGLRTDLNNFNKAIGFIQHLFEKSILLFQVINNLS